MTTLSRTSLIAYLLTLAVLVGFSVLLILDPAAYNKLMREDEAVETLGFLCLLLTGLILLVGGFPLTRPPTRFQGLLLNLAGAAFLFAAGEEISWGQRIIGFETPESLRQINEQGEFTLHNTEKGLFDHSVRYGIALFSLSGLVLRLAGIRRFLGFLAPTVPFILAYALNGIYQHVGAIDKPFYLSGAVLLASAGYFVVAGPPSRRWLALSAVLAAVLVLLLHWRYAASISPNATPEVREFLFALVSCLYALELVRDLRTEPARVS